MPQTDDELLASDIGDLEDWDEQRARAALDGRHGALHRNHLRIAVHLDLRAEAEGRRTDVSVPRSHASQSLGTEGGRR